MLNIADTFVQVSRICGDKTSIIEAKSGRSISFTDLDKRADIYAHYLKGQGLQARQTTMLMVSPSIEFIALTIALFKIGSPIVLIDPGMGFKNLLRCIERVAPEYLIGIPKVIAFSRLFSRTFQSVTKRFCCGRSLGILGADIRQYRETSGKEFEVFDPDTTDLAAIIFTTGSTGPPKGVEYSHSIFKAQVQMIQNYYKIGRLDTDQPAFPLFALFSNALGACSVIPDMDPTKPSQVDPEKFAASINKYNVSYSFGSPAIWNVVSRHCVQNNITLPSLKRVLMAGAPVPYELLGRMQRILSPDAEIHTPYGATESLPIVSIEGREILSATWAKTKDGKGTCVGRPLPGIDIRIIEASDEEITEISEARACRPYEIGEIIVRGTVVTRKYFNNEPETRLAKIRDGSLFWHRMGDVGYLDDEGRLWFCGRRAHRVINSKKIYYSIPCEAIINIHSDVFRSALVGVENKEREIVPVIVVEPVKNRRIRPEQLIREVRDLASSHKLTRDITLVLVHRDFPVDIRHNAKIFREKLAVWAQKKIFP